MLQPPARRVSGDYAIATGAVAASRLHAYRNLALWRDAMAKAPSLSGARPRPKAGRVSFLTTAWGGRSGRGARVRQSRLRPFFYQEDDRSERRTLVLYVPVV
jgi:hypothetical protein